MKRIFLVACLTLAISPLLAQNDPWVGIWKLNVAKSRYTGMPGPKSETRTVVAQGNGYQVTYEGIAADGSRISDSLTSNLDGKDSPISGTAPLGADTIATKRVDAYTITCRHKEGGARRFDGSKCGNQRRQSHNPNGKRDERARPTDGLHGGLGQTVSPPSCQKTARNPRTRLRNVR